MKRLIIILSIFFCAIGTMFAQKHFVYLTTNEVQIDSVLPNVGYRLQLPENYRDSVYTVTLEYPEYIDMSPSDIEKYNHLSGAALPEIPQPEYSVVFDKKKPSLGINVVPLAFRDGRYKWLTSFMLKIESTAVSSPLNAPAKADGEIYAEHSVLATGRWGKIRVSSTGVHELTESVIRQAGFSDINKVKIYGYGGNLQPEKLSSSYLRSTDDLQEVSQCVVNGKHYFYAKGPVNWSSSTTAIRARNFYSDYGYYFITQSDEAPTVLSEEEFEQSYIKFAYERNHSLYEKDGHAWFHSGRNLYDGTVIESGQQRKFQIEANADGDSGKLYIIVSSNETSSIQISLNDSILGTLKTNFGDNDKAVIATKNYTVSNINKINNVTVKSLSGGKVRLDYISLLFETSRGKYDLSSSLPAAEYVHNITNQDHHADPQADMVIIIPTSQKLLAQARRLADFHLEHDGLRTNIVPADELYNEFSSGTPDGNAYRRYLKMLYDRAETEADAPKYLLLFGDCIWDNRMVLPSSLKLNADDYLLSYQSDNSVNEIQSYISDLWFGALDEGEGSDLLTKDYIDVAVGRIPVTNANDAKIVVDKTINYMKNENAGAWQNVLMFMGDDGNENQHMRDVNDAAEEIHRLHPGFTIKKVMWDTYERVSNANGDSYPEVTALIKQQQRDGALIMDYAGHGSPNQLSHETVLFRQDFDAFTNENLPLWVTASCDIMPYDTGQETIGESALLNSKGGAVAFFGTTRTVWATYNKRINMEFLRQVLQNDGGAVNSIGEAHRLAHNKLISSSQDRSVNKVHYALIGDPALKLNLPKTEIVVDAINGETIAGNKDIQLEAGSKVEISGHVVGHDDFNGTVTAVMRDSEETITCRLNNTTSEGASTAFSYKDYTKTLFNGSNRVSDGQFSISFVIPMDINYSDAPGLLNLYAHDDAKSITANGSCSDFTIGGTSEMGNDDIGPSIYCYLNSPEFINGCDVNTTPYFVAQLNDEDGINVTGSGIGHDLTLTIDNDAMMTYNLNENFVYDLGSWTSGSTYLSLPALAPGNHTLKFRAWDIFNNSSTTELSFNVVESLRPSISSVSCTENPAKVSTTFIVNHNRIGSSVDIILEVMDMSGRLLWRNVDKGVTTDGAYTKTWDLMQSNGQELQTGVYLYRARVSGEGSEYDSKAKKLIVVR